MTGSERDQEVKSSRSFGQIAAALTVSEDVNHRADSFDHRQRDRPNPARRAEARRQAEQRGRRRCEDAGRDEQPPPPDVLRFAPVTHEGDIIGT